jgi:hypothetical protein
MSSVLYSNSIALILVLLAWYSLYHLRDDLSAAISEERVDRAIASRERKLARKERAEHDRKLNDREVWMSAANELLIETSSKSWTTRDQLEYERLRSKLNPNLLTPDYRKPPSQREFPVTPMNFRARQNPE